MITLQLFSGQLIDVDQKTEFSIKKENPFFCVGITELAHTQDLSVPATRNNNLIFAMDNVIFMDGWRRGRDCWLGYSAGEIAGKLYIKDYNNERYNLLFIYGSELDNMLTEDIGNFWEPVENIEVNAPKTQNIPADFGWMNYHEQDNDFSFSAGVTMMPVVNLGWMMDEASIAANYAIKLNGGSLSSGVDCYNAYNYGITLDSINVCDTYTVFLSSWAGRYNQTNYQAFDSNGNPVYDSAAGFQLTTIYLNPSLCYGAIPLLTTAFKATRDITVKLKRNTSIIAIGNGYQYLGTGDSVLYPYIQYDTTLYMVAGQTITFIALSDVFPTQGFLTPTHTINYSFDIIDSIATASVGDYIYLRDNLPKLSLLDLVRNFCLITSSYFIIDGDTKVINIFTIESAVNSQLTRGNNINLDINGKILSEGPLYRYIPGYTQKNIIECKSADYVCEENRYRALYRVDNDMLEEESIFGTITFNEGNVDGDGCAVFENVDLTESGVTIKPELCICYVNTGGGYSYHLRWVEDNYGMHNTMSVITGLSTTIVLTIKEELFKFLDHNPEDIYLYKGSSFLAKSSVWKDGVTELTLVKVDSVTAQGFREAP